MREVSIGGDMIRLGQFLKLADLIETGYKFISCFKRLFFKHKADAGHHKVIKQRNAGTGPIRFE